MDDDRTLIAEVAETIAVPKEAPADSFVLHAPLELLARAGLLEYVRPADRAAAGERVRGLAAEYAAAGDPVEPPAPVDVDSIEAGAARLVAAIEAGDLDDVDRLALWVGEHVTAAELRQLLAQPVAASLAAAAHASILLYLLPRVTRAADVRASIVRGPARELARHPDWRLRWFEDPDDVVATSALADALLDVPMLGLPGSNFIFPIMNQAEESGLAAKLLTGVVGGDAVSAGRDLARIAALSMLQEPPDQAPYGWSHCLTMPQAVIALAGHGSQPRTAIAVAATYVVGFRSALGVRSLAADYQPEPSAAPVPLADAIAAGQDVAAARVWHARDDELGEIVIELATRAALHHDAHLVKYTLACFDAAKADPSYRRLYLAAAASLSAWWAQFP